MKEQWWQGLQVKTKKWVAIIFRIYVGPKSERLNIFITVITSVSPFDLLNIIVTVLTVALTIDIPRIIKDLFYF